MTLSSGKFCHQSQKARRKNNVGHAKVCSWMSADLWISFGNYAGIFQKSRNIKEEKTDTFVYRMFRMRTYVAGCLAICGFNSSAKIPPELKKTEILRRYKRPHLGVQAAWESPILDITLSQLIQGATTPEDTARYRALRDKFAGAWLNALPSPQLGTLLSNESFRIAVSLRLGCDVCQPHKCPCGAQVTGRGYHGLSCRRSAGRWSRHEAANNVIARALRSAEVPCIRESAGCSTQDGKRPDGMTLIPWSRGKSLVWDVTCVDTFAPSYLPETVRYQGAAASKAEDSKRRRYAFLLDRFIFVPVAMETTGVWGQEGLLLINQIGERIAARTGQPNAVTFLRQRISLAVQRGNVASILGTLPEGKELEEVYYF
ncbi:uncharacterized protein LOC110855039 [Folsomia candida]|uniref:uncharacterized protein LOC110855039 n=1 Tax=Folsomia candida TaxID=158441 RepID=UPI001604B9A8|nr:uncharacterized protein LOC110855039 [Folsomia candida]